MKKTEALLVTFLLVAGALWAQTPDEPEIRSVGAATVEFINYEGPHSVVDTVDAIRSLGSALGVAVKGKTGPDSAGDLARYAVIRAIDPNESGKFDADILVIGASARVDHVRNLRLIIASYLETVHGYNRDQARVLATFITVYNAVHRGDLGYFGGKYKAVVLKNLTKENAGLSRRYDEWPGRSRIVIPLTGKAAAGTAKQGSGVDTGTLSEKPVTESMEKDEPGKGVDDRKGMVGMREGEIDEKKAELEKDKAATAAEEKAVEAEKARIAAEKEKLEAEKAAAGDSQSAELKKREAEIAAAEKEAAAREAAVAEDKAATAEKEAAIAAEEKAVADERSAIADAQKAGIAEEVAAKQEDPRSVVVVVELIDPNLPYARLARVNVDKNTVSKRSVVNTIRADSVIESGSSYLAVAGKPIPGAAIRIVKLNKDTLEQEKESAVDVFADTHLKLAGSELLAIVAEGGKHYLGSFDPATLALNRKSSIEVAPFTYIGVSDTGFVVQKPDGNFAILGKTDLKPVKEFSR